MFWVCEVSYLFIKKQSKSTHPIGKKLNVAAPPHKNMNQKIKLGTP